MKRIVEQALFANEAFYLAFGHKDVTAMDRIWSREEGLVCVHPGWRRLTAREEILESWRRILSNANQPGIDFANPQVQVHAGLYLVTCYETMPGATCLASNGFVEEEGELRMVLHHSSSSPPT